MVFAAGSVRMNGRTVTLKLNQQQRELIDRTVARGEAADRQDLIRRALREYAARYIPDASLENGDG